MNAHPSFDLESARALPGYWYLATPYTRYRLGIEEAFRAACIAAARLTDLDVPVVSPIAHGHPIAKHGGIDPLNVEFWIKFNAPLMAAASGLIVFTLRGWDESKGVQHERVAFDKAGKPIEWLAPEGLRRLLEAARAAA